MLDRHIDRERQRAVEAILGHYSDLYLPHAMLLPSARFGLYATAKALLAPGDRVLVSPITCRTVIHALLEAGVIPVFVNIELATGNIDVSRLTEPELRNARAIVTTNLYGNPDAVQDLQSIARMHNLVLIEDCAHVLHTRVGTKEIGGFGDVSVFSFKKYFDEVGGVVCARNAAAAAKIELRIAAEAKMPSAQEERLRFCQLQLTRATSPLIVRALSSMYRHLGTATGKGWNNRQSTTDNSQNPALFSSLPTTAALLRMVENLRRRQELITARTSATRNLIAQCPLPMKNKGYDAEVVYLAVPFFSDDRDAMVAKLRSRGIQVYFLYTPPMNVLFRGRAQSVPGFDQDRIDHWCRRILPVQPQFGEQFLEVVGRVDFVGANSPATKKEVNLGPKTMSPGRA